MLDKDTIIKVINRNASYVGYKVPDMGIRRQFAPGAVKEVTMEELRQLSYIPGGRQIIQHYLIIDNKDAVAELLGHVEPEYNYTDKEVTDLLLNGSIDQLLDCLDFAPQGVIELIKDIAVKIELNDVQKRNAILEKTKFNVTNAIRHNHESQEDDVAEEPKVRRTAAPVEGEAPARRTDVPRYKIVDV